MTGTPIPAVTPCLGLPGWEQKPCPKSAQVLALLPTHGEACGRFPSSQASDPHLGLLSWVPAGEGAMTALPSPPTNMDPTAVPGPGDMAKNQAGPQDPQLQFWETDTARKEADQSRSRLQTVAVARRKMRAEGLDAPSGSLPKPPGPLGTLL